MLFIFCYSKMSSLHLKKLLFLLLGLPMLLCSSCYHHKHHSDIDIDNDHTLLIYMEADNNLSGYAASNIEACIQGLLSSENPINLVIYKDSKENGSNLPVLFQLKRNDTQRSKVDTIYLKQWDKELNSSDPEVITDVINRTFSAFNTSVKGFEIWSHASSWLPSNNYSSTQSRAGGPDKAMEYIGQDYSNYTELWEFRKALENADYALDYLLCDACHMATAEVLYEFRNVFQYILSAPSEIMGDGFPYYNIIHALGECHDPESLPSALNLVFDCFQSKYANNGTFSMLSTEGCEELLKECQGLYAAANNCEAWDSSPRRYEQAIQHFGREYIATRYFFYDVKDWAEKVATLAPDYDLQPLYDALEKCVVRSYASQNFTDGLENLQISTCCGLALSVPNFWHLETYVSTSKFESAYQQLQWNLK